MCECSSGKCGVSKRERERNGICGAGREAKPSEGIEVGQVGQVVGWWLVGFGD